MELHRWATRKLGLDELCTQLWRAGVHMELDQQGLYYVPEDECLETVCLLSMWQPITEMWVMNQKTNTTWDGAQQGMNTATTLTRSWRTVHASSIDKPNPVYPVHACSHSLTVTRALNTTT